MASRRSPTAPRAGTAAPRRSWSALLSLSVVAATAAHVLVFVLSPHWEAPAPITRGAFGMALMEPVASARAQVASTSAGPPSPPEAQEPEVVAGTAAPADPEESSGDGMEALDRLTPSIVEAVAAASTSQDLRLLPLTAAPRAPQIEPAAASGLWRGILNVDQVLDFLRARYNRAVAASGLRGYVVIRVWVDPRGRVAHLEVHDSSGQETLDQIALELFTRVARFAPQERGAGSPMTTALISVPFQGAW